MREPESQEKYRELSIDILKLIQKAKELRADIKKMFQHIIGQAPAKVTIHLWLTGLFPINRNEGNINYKYFSQYHKDLKLAHSFFKNLQNETPDIP